MKDFLHNIFSRGSATRTDSPVVVVGGVSSNSSSLTIDVMHYDQTGNLLVNVAVGGGGGSQISGTVTAIVTAGTVTVQALLAGTVSALWPQRLDATNDAILVYGQARTNDIAPAATNGSNTPIITDSLGKVVTLPGAVNDLHVDGAVATPGVLAQTLIASQGAGRRIAIQSILVTNSGSQTLLFTIVGGIANRVFGYAPPGGGFALNAGGAPLYISSASIAISVLCDATATCQVFASGYAMSN